MVFMVESRSDPCVHLRRNSSFRQVMVLGADPGRECGGRGLGGDSGKPDYRKAGLSVIDRLLPGLDA
jgi:hypothetical protein